MTTAKERRDRGLREDRFTAVTIKTRVRPAMAERAHSLRRGEESNYSLYRRIFEVGVAALETVTPPTLDT